MILQAEVLNNLHLHMLNQSVPDKKDHVGYNKEDFSVLSGIALTDNIALYELCSRLIKYVDSQLGGMLDKDDLIESAQYYNSLSNGFTPVKVVVEGEYATFDFPFNPYLNGVVKLTAGVENVHFDYTNKIWKVRLSKAMHVLQALGEYNVDVRNSIKYLQNHHDLPTIITIKLQGVDGSPELVRVICPYNEHVRHAIKKLSYKSFNFKSKAWTILRTELGMLYSLLKGVEHVDLSNFQPMLNLSCEDCIHTMEVGCFTDYGNTLESSGFKCFLNDINVSNCTSPCKAFERRGRGYVTDYFLFKNTLDRIGVPYSLGSKNDQLSITLQNGNKKFSLAFNQNGSVLK